MLNFPFFLHRTVSPFGPGMDFVHVSLLYEAILAAEPKRVLEVGCGMGTSTYGLVRALDDLNGSFELHLDDIGFHPFVLAVRDLTIHRKGKVIFRRASSLDILPEDFDFVFLDGDHTLTHVAKEVALLEGRNIPVICGHDTHSLSNGVGTATLCDGPPFLLEKVREWGYKVILDCEKRDGMLTERGFFVATLDDEIYIKLAQRWEVLKREIGDEV